MISEPYFNFSRRRIMAVLLDNMVIIIFLALALALAIFSPLFLTPSNMLNILRQVSVIAILSVGFTLVLGAGELDLSVGAIMGLTGVFMAEMMVAGIPSPIAVIFGIGSGVLCGFFNATLITVFRLNSLITTLATAGIYRGMIYLITDTKAVSGLPDEFNALGQGTWFGIPIPIFVMIAAVIVIFLLINRTVFGRHAIAVGGNIDAAVVAGINTARVRLAVYGIMGAAAGLAGAVQTARSASAQVTAGSGIELDAIAAVVIGGTALFGGNARVIGTVFGCLIVGMVGNGLNLMAINANWQIVAKGALILFAIILDSASSGLVGKFARGGKEDDAYDTKSTPVMSNSAPKPAGPKAPQLPNNKE